MDLKELEKDIEETENILHALKSEVEDNIQDLRDLKSAVNLIRGKLETGHSFFSRLKWLFFRK